MKQTSQRFTLTKSERLKSRKLIEQLFREGKSFSNHPFKILYLVAESGYAPLQSGFAVSKKNFKKAVDRNRIKRLIKEAYRLQKKALTGKLHHQKKFMTVFFIYTGNVLPKYEIVSEKIYVALHRLEKIADENISPNS
ncbi:MAG: ribonuclease P protein component [Ginsengibacter sp.]